MDNIKTGHIETVLRRIGFYLKYLLLNIFCFLVGILTISFKGKKATIKMKEFCCENATKYSVGQVHTLGKNKCLKRKPGEEINPTRIKYI